jgi:hypothetical protein
VSFIGGSFPVKHTDETASVDAGQYITWAEGSFPSVVGVMSETDSVAGSNQYTLQLNSNFFNTSLCNGSGNPACQGFQQFNFSQASSSGPGYVWMQYWLISYYNPATCMTDCCPPPVCGDPTRCWQQNGGDCMLDSSSSTTVPFQAITNLASLTLTATASSNDAVVLSNSTNQLYTWSQASVLGLSAGWQQAEFNIFGESGSSTAQIYPNPGSTIMVQTLTSAGSAAPGCFQHTYTNEANSLTLVPNFCCSIGGHYHGILFEESNVTGIQAPACPVAPPVTLAASSPYQYIAVDSSNVYWNTSGNQTLACSINGCSSPTQVYAPPSGNMDGVVAPAAPPSYSPYVFSLATDPGNDVYLGKTTKSSGSSTTTYPGFYAAYDLVFDSVNSEFFTISENGGQFYVNSFNASGTITGYGPSQTLKISPYAYLGIDTNSIYIPDTGNGRVLYCPLSASESCGSAATALTGLTNPYAAYSDGTNLWVLSSGTGSNGTVSQCPVMTDCAMQPTPFASGRSGLASAMVVAGSSDVYWSETGTSAGDGKIMSCPVAGCGSAPTVRVAGLTDPSGIAQDNTSIYFLDAYGVYKLAKP